MKILFACDLDNTLIHSYKKSREGDICIEIYNGREQSFMSRQSVGLLKKIIEKILFVPITTRSVEQYQRIAQNPNFPAPKYAVTSNGAFLLRDGEVVENLAEDVKNFEAELNRQFEKFCGKSEFAICRIVDGHFLFLRCADNVCAEKICGSLQAETNLKVQYFGQKIYLFPPNLNKGEALKNLTKKFSPDKVFCAGDSEIDLPMLKLADVAYFPKNLAEKNFVSCSESPIFAEEFLQNFYTDNLF